jgi:hypothetical protein
MHTVAMPSCSEPILDQDIGDLLEAAWRTLAVKRFCFWIRENDFFVRGKQKMIYRIAVAIFVGLVVAGAAVGQSVAPSSSEKQETSCTTSSKATSGNAGEETSNSMAIEKSAILPDAGGSNSAAPTVQSGGKPLEVRSECPPDSKPK